MPSLGGPALGDHDQAPLTAKWRHWRVRAELALKLAVERDYVSVERLSEREKGSAPTTKPACHGALHRLAQTIALRRLLRLHRQ
eukprot:2569166-Pyramimonas_sp.AAC.1